MYALLRIWILPMVTQRTQMPPNTESRFSVGGGWHAGGLAMVAQEPDARADRVLGCALNTCPDFEWRGCLLPPAEDVSPLDSSAFVIRAERTPGMQVQVHWNPKPFKQLAKANKTHPPWLISPGCPISLPPEFLPWPPDNAQMTQISLKGDTTRSLLHPSPFLFLTPAIVWVLWGPAPLILTCRATGTGL